MLVFVLGCVSSGLMPNIRVGIHGRTLTSGFLAVVLKCGHGSECVKTISYGSYT